MKTEIEDENQWNKKFDLAHPNQIFSHFQPRRSLFNHRYGHNWNNLLVKFYPIFTAMPGGQRCVSVYQCIGAKLVSDWSTWWAGYGGEGELTHRLRNGARTLVRTDISSNRQKVEPMSSNFSGNLKKSSNRSTWAWQSPHSINKDEIRSKLMK